MSSLTVLRSLKNSQEGTLQQRYQREVLVTSAVSATSVLSDKGSGCRKLWLLTNEAKRSLPGKHKRPKALKSSLQQLAE